MADDFNYEANIEIDVTDAYKSVAGLTNRLESLNRMTVDSDRSLVRAERGLRSFASTMKSVEKNSRSTAVQFTREAHQVNKLAREYEQLVRSKGKAFADKAVSGNTFGAVKQGVNDNLKYEQDFAKLQQRERQQAEQRANDTARAMAVEREKIAENSRQRELRQMREFMQEKERLRKRDVNDAHKQALEVAKAAEKAYPQNALRNASMSANSMPLMQNLRTDPLAQMRGTQEYADLMDRSMQGLANQRYAMYDVATSLTAVGTALAGSAIAAATFGAQFDKAFASVERTTMLTGDAAGQMRNQLIGLSTEIPSTFQDLSSIATMGAQMDISNDALEGFTETVATFAATTDVTVDSAAMGFGRLAQLTKTPQNEISNLASAIYETGINAVATEGEILSVSQQIATAGDLAGFTNTEIIALGSALSSLGVAPEQARGAFQRIFNNIIPTAVSEGGEVLEGFAETASMTAQEFATAWQTEPQKAFSAFLTGLSEVEDRTATLRSLGIVNVRDLNVLTRLSNNMEVYEAALGDTARAYEENTALSEGAKIQFDNLADAAVQLLNGLKALAAESGFAEWLTPLVKWLGEVTQGFITLIDTPVGGFLATTIGVIGLLGGALAGVGAVIFTARAAMLAMVTALRANTQAAGATTLSVKALSLELLRLNAGTSRAAAGMLALSGASGTATTRVRALGTAMKGALVGTGIGAAVIAAFEAIRLLNGAFEDGATKAENYFNEIGSAFTTDAITAAVREDTAAFEQSGEALRVVQVEAQNTAAATSDLAAGSDAAAGSQTNLANANDAVTQSLGEQSAAIGRNTAELLAQSLATDENFQKIYQHAAELEAVGFSMEELINRILADPSGRGGSNYLDELSASAISAKDQITDTSTAALNASASLGEMSALVEQYESQISSSIQSQQIFADVMKASGHEVDMTGEIMEGTAVSAENLGNSMEDLVNSMTDSISDTHDMQEALYGLGESLYENGNAFDAFSVAGRANMDALQNYLDVAAANAGEDSEAFANNVIAMMGSLQEQGVHTGGELSFLGDMLNTLVGNEWGIDFNSTEARKDIFKFIDASIEALKARAELERQTIQAQEDARSAFNAGISQFNDRAPFGINLKPVDTVVSTSGLDSINSAISGLESMKQSIDTATSNTSGGSNSLETGFRNAAAAAREAGSAGNKAGNDSAKGSKKAADAANKTAKEFRTLKDYADDLGTVFDMQLDLSFNLPNARDSRKDAWKSLREDLKAADKAVRDAKQSIKDYRDDVRDARQAVKEFNAELRGLRADRTVLQYQLGVAVEYGDDLRAAEIRAELAENSADISKAENNRKDAQDDVRRGLKELNKAEKALDQARKDAQRTLKGSTEAGRKNRDAVQALVRAYADELQAMAENGASKRRLKQRSEEMRREFERQLRQMGFNRSEVRRYSREFSDFTRVIKRVPKKVTVKGEARMSSAQRAINSFLRKNRNKTITYRSKVKSPGNVKGGTWSPKRTRPGNASGGTYRPSSVYSRGTLTAPRFNTGTVSSKYFIDGRGNARWGPGGSLPRATGGPVPKYLATGGVAGLHPGKPRGTDTIPAWLTPGEWVVQKKAVDHYGADFFASLNAMKYPASYLAQGTGQSTAAPSGPAVQIVELLPNQLAQIVRGVSTKLEVDGKVIADTVNNQNRAGSVRGSN